MTPALLTLLGVPVWLVLGAPRLSGFRDLASHASAGSDRDGSAP